MTVSVYVILRSEAEPVLSGAEGKNLVLNKRRGLFCMERDPSRSLSWAQSKGSGWHKLSNDLVQNVLDRYKILRKEWLQW